MVVVLLGEKDIPVVTLLALLPEVD